MERRARTVLDALVHASNRTVEETCVVFNALAAEMKAGTSVSPRQLARWMAGEVGDARPATRRVAERMWGGVPFGVLTRPPMTGGPRGDQVDTDVAGGSVQAWVLETVADATARESVEHAARAGVAINPTTIEQLADDLRALARRYPTTPPLAAVGQAATARDRAYELLKLTCRPGQQEDLYLLAGQACGLMAHAAVDTAAWTAAAAQTRAALTYADIIGHDGLRSWAVGTAALIDYWSGRPGRAAGVAAAGIPTARRGAPVARLWAIQARAYALAGAGPDRVHEAITEGDRALHAADGHDPLFDEVGGEFGWGPSLHAACAGTALIAAGDHHAAAVRLAQALEFAVDDPYAALVPERVWADVALAEVAGGRLDDAAAALAHVWPVPAERRRVGVVGRLEAVASALRTGRWAGDPAADELRDQVLAFTTVAARQWALPAG